jgi:hypothetical protein
MIHNELLKQSDESINDYLIRLGDNQELYGLTWMQTADLLNKESGDEYSESRWRKKYSAYLEWKPVVLEKYANNEIADELRDATLEAKKEKFKLQDQKRELNNLIRQQARYEHLKDEVSLAINELAKVKPLKFEANPKIGGIKKGVALWSDWHIGSDFANSFNTYNTEVFRNRLEHLINKTIEHAKANNVTDLIVANLGDAISGAIHVSTRVQSSEDVIRQIQIAAEAMSESLVELSKYFNTIKFINIIGNHSRLVSNKNESLFTENLEYLIPWFMDARLKNVSNIEIVKDSDGFSVEEIEGESFVFCHGDLDSAQTSAKNIPQILGIVPKAIFSAHIHHNYEKEFGKTETIVNGSMMGVDDYAVSKRYYASPMQKFIVLDGNEIECTYKIKFNN